MSIERLQHELDAWSRAGLRARIFLRDDDAVAPTPPLDRLLSLTADHGMPLLLAVVPAHVEAALAKQVADVAHVSVGVHGWSHENHAPAPEKRCELGHHRARDAVVDDCRRGLAAVAGEFGRRHVPVLVPPWNRMRADIGPALAKLGYRAVSMFGWRVPDESAGGVARLNTHVDLMDWRSAGGRRGKPADAVLSELAEALRAARQAGGQPVGVLSHHLVHDDDAWRALEEVVRVASTAPAAQPAAFTDCL